MIWQHLSKCEFSAGWVKGTPNVSCPTNACMCMQGSLKEEESRHSDTESKCNEPKLSPCHSSTFISDKGGGQIRWTPSITWHHTLLLQAFCQGNQIWNTQWPVWYVSVSEASAYMCTCGYASVFVDSAGGRRHLRRVCSCGQELHLCARDVPKWPIKKWYWPRKLALGPNFYSYWLHQSPLRDPTASIDTEEMRGVSVYLDPQTHKVGHRLEAQLIIQEYIETQERAHRQRGLINVSLNTFCLSI